jgi:hypothetical protein
MALIQYLHPQDGDADAEDVKRTAHREISLLRSLQHPHVVGCLDDFFVRDRLFIVMEFVPCNLLELLEAQAGGLSAEAVRLIMYQLCTAMSHIHSKVRKLASMIEAVLCLCPHPSITLATCDAVFKKLQAGTFRFSHDVLQTHLYPPTITPRTLCTVTSNQRTCWWTNWAGGHCFQNLGAVLASTFIGPLVERAVYLHLPSGAG